MNKKNAEFPLSKGESEPGGSDDPNMPKMPSKVKQKLDGPIP